MAVSVLIIAGSDPSGGAGVQADIRVICAIGAAALTAITALTVQNSQGVRRVSPVDVKLLSEQLEVLFSDKQPEAVKIGMLAGEPQVRAVADALKAYRPPHIVLDPVMVSSSGADLLDTSGRKALATELLPLCDLVTPNMAEASALTGRAVDDVDGMRAAGERLLGMGAKAALVTGGHLPGTPIDILVTKEDGAVRTREFRYVRVKTEHTHGTGCFQSSAIAAYLAFGAPLVEAVDISGGLLNAALRSPVVVGKGRGYPNVAAAIRARQAE